MKKKSKFLTFLLSFIPGFGQLYLGFSKRALCFFLAAVGDVVMTIFLMEIHFFYDPVTLILLPVIWLGALVDSIVLADKINNGIDVYTASEGENSIPILMKENYSVNNKFLISLLLSIVPGAGHMYLGLMKKGVQLMISFFLAFFLTDFLQISIFMIIVPIIWFYSIFDVLHMVSSTKELKDDDIPLFSKFQGINSDNGRILGISLIVIGCLVIFQKLAMPILNKLLGYEYTVYLRTFVIAILFILGGIKLIIGSKSSKKNN